MSEKIGSRTEAIQAISTFSADNQKPSGSQSENTEKTIKPKVYTRPDSDIDIVDIKTVDVKENENTENVNPAAGESKIPDAGVKGEDRRIEKPEKKESEPLPPVKKKREGRKKLSRKTKKIIKTVVILVIIALLIIIGVLYVRNKMKEGMDALREQFSSNLTPAQVEKKDLTENISVTGKIRSNETRTQITSLQTANVQSAKILSVNVEVGDYVNEGDVLVTFSTEDIEKSIARTEEDLARQKKLDNIQIADSQRNYVYNYQQVAETLEANAKATDRALKSLYEACDAYGDAKRSLQEAKDKLEELKNSPGDNTAAIIGLEEKIPLLESNVSTAKANEERAQQAYDDAVESEAQGSKGLQNMQNTLSNADSEYQKSQINAGQQAQSYSRSLQDQQDKLDDYIVTASMSGLVTSVKVSEGNSFSTGEVLTIQDVSKLKVDAEVDEYDIWKVKKGQRVLVKTEATGDEEFDAVVSLVHPTATAASASAAAGSSTPTYTVTVDLLDKDERLMLGMTAKMSIIVNQQEDVLCVPYDAIGQNADGEPVVYVLDDMSLIEKHEEKEKAKSSNPFGPGGFFFGNNDEKDKDGKKNPIITIDKEKDAEEPSEEDMYHEVVVKVGMETDYYTEIITDKLKEGDYIVIKNEDGGNDLFNMMMGGMPPG